MAALAKLHVKFAWPVEYLATQPKGGQFDLAVFRSVSGDAMLIACEAKKTEQEALFLVSELTRLSHENVQIGVGLKNEQRNAFRKLAAIRDRKPDLLWIIGPGEHKRVFQITYEPHVALHYASEELLHFERRGSLTFEERPFEIITLEQAKALNGKITLPIADALKQAAYKISNPQIREAALDAIRRNDEVTAWKIISGPDGPSEYIAEQS